MAIVAMVSSNAFAQVDVGASGVGLLSFQPIDDSYVGGPYLSEGIGGVGPGFGAGVSLITGSGLVIAGEYSTVRFEQEQSGRLVLGGFPFDGVPATTRLHDSLLSGLIGYATTGPTRIVVLAGLGVVLDDPTINGEPRKAFSEGREQGPPVALTGGVDVHRPFNGRAALLFGVRYSYAERAETHRYLGIGPHLLRASVGIRLRLN